jgi:cobalamin-dependent methionine synthase I
MPSGSEDRVENASRMIEHALGKGIPPERIFVDPLVFPISVDGAFGEHCLAAIRELRARLDDPQRWPFVPDGRELVGVWLRS